MKAEILYGVHPVNEALGAGRRTVEALYFDPGGNTGRIRPVLDRARGLAIPVQETAPARLKSLCGSSAHQGIAARVGPYPLVDLDGVTGRSAPDAKAPLVVVLDGVMDPHNLGAVARTALCAGATGMVIPKDRSAQPTPAVSRVSAGAVEHLAIARVTNLARSLDRLKDMGLWVLGLDRGGADTVFAADLTGPTALVVGGEESGIRRLVRDHCDGTIAVPQFGPVDSLNASVAAAVVLYEAVRQRHHRDHR